MAWKLPGFDASAGTAEQPAPKVVIMSAGAELSGALLAIVVGAAAVPSPSVEESLPQAVSEIEKRVAAASAVNFIARMIRP
jgi:hypothetical protein